VVVEVLEHCGSEIAPLYQPNQKELVTLHARYTSRELAIVVRYLTEALDAGARFVAWLQTQPSHSKHPVRLTHVTHGSFGEPARRRSQEQQRRSARRKKRAPQESTS
jgi:hypothetical protein